MKQKHFSITKTADKLEINRATLKRWIESGIIKPSFKNKSGRTFFSQEDVEKFLSKEISQHSLDKKLDRNLELLK